MSADPALKLSGLKYAMEEASDPATAATDIPIERLDWTYHNYGADAYSKKTEVFLIACGMNSVNNRSYLSNNNIARRAAGPLRPLQAPEPLETASIRVQGSWQERATHQLNLVLMSAQMSDVNTPDIPISTIKNHFLFWNLDKQHRFVISCYDYLDGISHAAVDRRKSPVNQAMLQLQFDQLKTSLNLDHEALFEAAWPRGWFHRVSHGALRMRLMNNQSFQPTVYHLVATIRCREPHYHEGFQEIQAFFGASPDQYITEWLNMFPGLIPHLVRWILRNGLQQTVPTFGEYFLGEPEFWGMVADTSLVGFPIAQTWP